MKITRKNENVFIKRLLLNLILDDDYWYSCLIESKLKHILVKIKAFTGAKV